MALPPIPNEKRVGPIGYAPIAEKDGKATNFFARQWLNLIGLVQEVIDLKDESNTNAARIAVLEGTEIGGTAGQITPLPAPLLDGNITLQLADTAVTPGTYGDGLNTPQLTVDSKGRVTGVINIQITGGGGGGGGGDCWELVTTRTIAAGTISEDITDLGDYDDLLVFLDNSTASTSQQRIMRVSVDNGVSFFSTSGDYQIIAASGSISNQSFMAGSSATSAARSAAWLLINKNSAEDPKLVQANSNYFFIRTASAIDAIQIRSGTVGTIDSGTIYVFGKTCGGGGGGGGDVAVEDDGTAILAAASILNFTGAGVAVTDAGGGQADINIPGGGGGGDVAVEDDGVSIVAAASTLNFTGAGVVVTDAGSGQVDIDIEPVELFLGPSDETDDSDPVYFYFGWASVDGSWLIRRQTRSTSLTLNANIVNNASYANLSAAWPARASLTYS